MEVIDSVCKDVNQPPSPKLSIEPPAFSLGIRFSQDLVKDKESAPVVAKGSPDRQTPPASNPETASPIREVQDTVDRQQQGQTERHLKRRVTHRFSRAPMPVDADREPTTAEKRLANFIESSDGQDW